MLRVLESATRLGKDDVLLSQTYAARATFPESAPIRERLVGSPQARQGVRCLTRSHVLKTRHLQASGGAARAAQIVRDSTELRNTETRTYHAALAKSRSRKSVVDRHVGRIRGVLAAFLPTETADK